MRFIKLFLLAFVAMIVACNGNREGDVVAIVPDVPTTVPTIPEGLKLKADSFPQCVDIRYQGDTALVLNLPQGVVASVKGAHVVVRSSVAGVEFAVTGKSNDGSLRINGNNPLLVSLKSLMLFSKQGNAISVVSPAGLYLRGVDSEPNYIMDGAVVAGDYVAKNSAAIRIDGNAVICGGNIAVRGERMSAIHCSGKMVLDNVNLSVEKAVDDAIVADSGIVVASGNISVTQSRDAFKSKRGNVVVLGGNINVKGAKEKGDAVQARNFYLYGGNVDVKLDGDVARGINSKGAVYLMDGVLNVETTGGAIFSAKKADYSSASCVKSGTHTYIANACVSLVNRGAGGKCVNCDGMMQMDGGILSVVNYGEDVQHPQEVEGHSSAKGVKCDSSLLIKGGIIDIRVFGKGERTEGLEAKKDIIIAGNAAMNIFAYDDAINSGRNVLIEGGRVYAYSVANDGVDVNGKMSLKGGLLVANGSFVPEQGIDVDGDARFDITGGTFISLGGTFGAYPTLPRSALSTQSVVACTGFELTRGKYAAWCNADGEPIYSYRLPRTSLGGALVFSSPQLSIDEKYIFVLCDTVVGAVDLGNGLSMGGKVNATLSSEWLQEQQFAVLSPDGVKFLEKMLAADNGGFPAPPFGGDGGGFPAPPFGGDGGGFPAPPFGGDGGGFPAPPFGGDGGGFPAPPFGGEGGGFPAPPFGGEGGGFPAPAFRSMDNEGYNETNLPASGWAPIKR